VQETIRDDENIYQDGVRGATQRLFRDGLSRQREPEPGATSSIATVKQEVAATREATRQQMQTLAKLVETVEMQELSTNQRLALVDEFASTLEQDAPAREATTTLRAALDSGGPLTTRNVMLGAYGFGGVGIVSFDKLGAFGVMLEAGRVRWRYFQVSSVRASIGTTTQPTYGETGYGQKTPMVAGIGLGGIGFKAALDAIGRHEVGFLTFPLSISWIWASHKSSTYYGDEEGSQTIRGFLRSAVYYRFGSPKWAFEAGLDFTPLWRVPGGAYYGPLGDEANNDLPPIVLYAGATWPL
jgi:hypothetical protein